MIETHDYSIPANCLEQLNRIGAALSAERNPDVLLESILTAARQLTRADAGTLYRVLPDGRAIQFAILQNDTLGVHLGGGNPIQPPPDPISLYLEDGTENMSLVVTAAALTKKTINIRDVEKAEGFDFSGTRKFAERTGYSSVSFLTVPLLDHKGVLIGLLQLINAIDPLTKRVGAFSILEQQLAESLASQAAIVLNNRNLITQMEHLFEGMINLVNTAIDKASQHTGDHCKRVPEITLRIADAVARQAKEWDTLKDFSMNEEQRYELRIASMLHDCGKLSTPLYLLDKSTKLHTLFDRIHVIEGRLALMEREAYIVCLERKLKGEDAAIADAEYAAAREDILALKTFLEECNSGEVFMSEARHQQLQAISQRTWRNLEGDILPLLTAEETDTLSILRGTLTAAERQKINDHIKVTIQMLESLPWPKHLERVPEFAGGHHERVDGKGYPKGLKRDQLSVPARMMAIADVFEALTSSDRPYKPAKTIREALFILDKMAEEGHVDPDIYAIFKQEKVWFDYGLQYLNSRQMQDC